MLLLLYYVWRWMAFLRIPPTWGIAAFAGVTFCPLLLSSTTMLHIDGLLGIYLACGLIAYIEALDEPSVGRALLAGLLLTDRAQPPLQRVDRVAAVALAECGISLAATHAPRTPKDQPAATPRHPRRLWIVFAIVVGLVATVGMQHYYRILATYGTLDPAASFVRPDPTPAQFNPYVRMILQQQRWKMVAFLVMIFPVLPALLLPATWTALQTGCASGPWGPVALLIFVSLSLLDPVSHLV